MVSPEGRIGQERPRSRIKTAAQAITFGIVAAGFAVFPGCEWGTKKGRTTPAPEPNSNIATPIVRETNIQPHCIDWSIYPGEVIPERYKKWECGPDGKPKDSYYVVDDPTPTPVDSAGGIEANTDANAGQTP